MKKKLGLNDLKVKSFVTNFDNHEGKTVKGGMQSWPGEPCDTDFPVLCGGTNYNSCNGTCNNSCAGTCNASCGGTCPPATQNTCNPIICGEPSFNVPGCIIP